MHQIPFSAGAPPQTPLGELTALPRSISGFKGGLLLTEGEREERKWEKGKRGKEKGEDREGGGVPFF